MCITFFYLGGSSTKNIGPYKFIQVFNREESHERSTQSLDFWEEDRNILAGRDILAKGTWLGVNIKTGNIAFLTNIDIQHLPPGTIESPISRGELISNFLKTDFFESRMAKESTEHKKEDIVAAIDSYVIGIQEFKRKYKGFNLVVGNLNIMEFRHIGNDKLNNGAIEVKPGFHGMTSQPLVKGCRRVIDGLDLIQSLFFPLSQDKLGFEEIVEKLETVAKDRFKFPYSNFDEILDVEGQKKVVKTSIWVTKTTSLILVDEQNNLKFMEITYDEEFKKKNTILRECQIGKVNCIEFGFY